MKRLSKRIEEYHSAVMTVFTARQQGDGTISRIPPQIQLLPALQIVVRHFFHLASSGVPPIA